MRVKLKVGKVIDGAVWLKDTTPDVPEDRAREWIRNGEAEPVGASKSAEPAPKEEKDKK